MELIDKAAVVAEIERLRKSFKVISVASPSRDTTLENIAKAALCRQILSFLDTLEVKEVDSVWHNASEIPKGAGDKEILVQFADSHASVLEIDDWEYLDHQTKWAYLKDLI